MILLAFAAGHHLPVVAVCHSEKFQREQLVIQFGATGCGRIDRSVYQILRSSITAYLSMGLRGEPTRPPARPSGWTTHASGSDGVRWPVPRARQRPTQMCDKECWGVKPMLQDPLSVFICNLTLATIQLCTPAFLISLGWRIRRRGSSSTPNSYHCDRARWYL